MERETNRPVDENLKTEANVAVGGSQNLATVVEQVETAQSPGRPLSEQFRNEVISHDKTRCVASLVFEDLWNGFDGWKSSQYFWDVVIFVWRNAPDFFVEYDPDREIVEDSTRWTQRYFDEQRNYLRHNFCLKRLCHLVMVYKHLHGAEVDGDGGEAPPAQPASPPCPVREEGTNRASKYGVYQKVAFVVGGVVLVVCLLAYWVASHRDKTSPDVETSKQDSTGESL